MLSGGSEDPGETGGPGSGPPVSRITVQTWRTARNLYPLGFKPERPGAERERWGLLDA
jgi:hypothetical protein